MRPLVPLYIPMYITAYTPVYTCTDMSRNSVEEFNKRRVRQSGVSHNLFIVLSYTAERLQAPTNPQLAENITTLHITKKTETYKYYNL